MFPYKVYVERQLSLDCEKHHYYEWVLAKVNDDLRMLDVTFFSDETWFHHTGYVSSEYWLMVRGKSA